MIVSRIDGGLGNQMFQYAFGLYLARQQAAELVLDVSSYDRRPAHGFLLDQFQIEAKIADRRMLDRVPRKSNAFWDCLRVWVPEKLRGPRQLRRVRQKPFGFHPRYLRTQNDSYLDGYWQSELFFPGLRATLLNHFQPARGLSYNSLRVQDGMQNFNSMAIHVRRGDYVSNPTNVQIYRQLDVDYYRACIEDWAKHRSNAKVFVFSNDIGWCRNNLTLTVPIHFVDRSDAGAVYEDLLLMAQASCVVTANSTFSWWGAWLNDRIDKTVYAPRQWFHPGKLDERDIHPCDWIPVEVDFPTAARRNCQVVNHSIRFRENGRNRAA